MQGEFDMPDVTYLAQSLTKQTAKNALGFIFQDILYYEHGQKVNMTDIKKKAAEDISLNL